MNTQDPREFKVEPTYKKENGLYVLDIYGIEPPFLVKERSLVCIPAGQFGGNHKHPRQEAFIGIGEELELVWQVGAEIYRKKMNPNGEPKLFVIPPFVPHAVINHSPENSAVLIEYADDVQHDVENCHLV